MTQEPLNPYWGLEQPQAGPLGGALDDNSSIFLSSSDNSTELWVEPGSSTCLPSSSDAHSGSFSLRTARAVAVSEHVATPVSEPDALLQRSTSATPSQSHLSRAGGPLLWRLFPRCIRASNDEVCIAAEVSLKAAPSECKVTAIKDGGLLPVRFEFVNDRQATGDDDDQPSRHGRGPGNNSTISAAAAALRRRAANDALQALRAHRPDSELLLIWLTPGTTPGLLFIELHVPSPGVESSLLTSPAARSGASTGALPSAWHTGYHPMSGTAALDAAVAPLAGLRVGREPTTTLSAQRGPDGNDLGGAQRGHFSPLTVSVNRMRVYNLSGPDPLPGRNGPGVGASGGTGSVGGPPGMRGSGAMSVVVVPDAEMEAEVCGMLALQHQQTPLPMPQTDVDGGLAGEELPRPHAHAARFPDPAGAPQVAQSALATLEAQQRYGGAHGGSHWHAAVAQMGASASAAAEATDVGQESWHLQGAGAPSTSTTTASAPAPAPAPPAAPPARSLLASGQSSAFGGRAGSVLSAELGPQQPSGEGEEDQKDARARERFLWDLGAWLEMSAQAALARQVQAVRAAREAQLREDDQAQQLEQLAQQPRQQPLPERVLWQLGTVAEVELSEENGLGLALGEPMPHRPAGSRVLSTGFANPSGRSLGARAAAFFHPSMAAAAPAPPPPPPGSSAAAPPPVALMPLPQSALELLGFACSRGWAATSTHIVLGLMDMGHPMAEINTAVQAAHGWSALHLAVASGSAELMGMAGLWRSYGRYSDSVTVQEEWRAMLAAAGPGGLTPLHLAAVLPHPATAALDLLSTLPTETLSTWFGVPARDGCTPAHYASRAGNSHLNDHALLCLATGTAALDLGTAQGLQEVLPYMGDALSLSNSESAESERASAGGGLVSVEPGLANSVSSSWAPASTNASRDEANSAGSPRSAAFAAGAAGGALAGHGLEVQQPLWLGPGGGGGVLQLAAGHGGGRAAGRSAGGTGVAANALWSDGALSSSGVASMNAGAWQSMGSQRASAQRTIDSAALALAAAVASAGAPSPRVGCQPAAFREGAGGGGVRCLGSSVLGGSVLEPPEAWHDQQRVLTRAGDQAGLWMRARAEQQGYATRPGMPASFEAEDWAAQGLGLRPAVGLAPVPPPPPPPSSDPLSQLQTAAPGHTTSQPPWQQQQQQMQASQPPEPQWMLPQQPLQQQQQQQRALRSGRLNPAHMLEAIHSHEPWQPRRVWPEPSAVVVGLLGRVSPAPSTHGSLAASQQSHQHQQPQPLGASGLLSMDPNLLCQPMSLDEARQAAWRLVAAVGAARAVATAPAESAVQPEVVNSVGPAAGGVGTGSGPQAYLPRSAPADGAPRLLSEMADLPVAELSRVFQMRSHHHRQMMQAQLEMLLRPGCLPVHLLQEHQGQTQPQPQPQAQQDPPAAVAGAAVPARRGSGGSTGAVEGPAVAAPSKKPAQEAAVEAGEERSGDVVRSQAGRAQLDQASEPLVAQAAAAGVHTVVARLGAAEATPPTDVVSEAETGAEVEVEVSVPAGRTYRAPGGPGGAPAAAPQQPGRQEDGPQPRRYDTQGVLAAGAALALGRTALSSRLVSCGLVGGGMPAAAAAAAAPLSAVAWALVGVVWPLLTSPAAAARLAASPLRLQLLGAALHAAVLTMAAFAPFRTASSAAVDHHTHTQHLPGRGGQGGRADGREAGASLALLPLIVLDLCSALLVGLLLRCWCGWRRYHQQRPQAGDCGRIGGGLDVAAAGGPPPPQQQPPTATALAVLGRLFAAAGLGDRSDDGQDDLSSLIDIRPPPPPPPPAQDAVGTAAAGWAAQVPNPDAGADG